MGEERAGQPLLRLDQRLAAAELAELRDRGERAGVAEGEAGLERGAAEVEDIGIVGAGEGAAGGAAEDNAGIVALGRREAAAVVLQERAALAPA